MRFSMLSLSFTLTAASVLDHVRTFIIGISVSGARVLWVVAHLMRHCQVWPCIRLYAGCPSLVSGYPCLSESAIGFLLWFGVAYWAGHLLICKSVATSLWVFLAAVTSVLRLMVSYCFLSHVPLSCSIVRFCRWSECLEWAPSGVATSA